MAEQSKQADFKGLVALGEGLWIEEGPVRFLGMRLMATMTVLRLDDAVLVHCPLPLTPERRNAVESVGPVKHLYAPNLFHHLHIGEWADAFPEALVHAPGGLSRKRPDVRIDRVHGDEPSLALDDSLEEIVIEGCRLGESVLFHHPTRTLIAADLVHNIGRPEHAWTACYTRMMGFYDRIAISRILRWTAFPDRAVARASMERLLDTRFERIVVGHGPPIGEGARDALARAYSWL